jgi:hypothetical protein
MANFNLKHNCLEAILVFKELFIHKALQKRPVRRCQPRSAGGSGCGPLLEKDWAGKEESLPFWLPKAWKRLPAAPVRLKTAPGRADLGRQRPSLGPG